MSTVEEIVNAWDLPQATKEQLKPWLSSPEVGWDLQKPPSKGFFLLKSDDLKEAGFTVLSDRERILAELLTEPGAQKGDDRKRNQDLSEFWRKLPSATMDEKRVMDLPAVPADLSFMPPLQRIYVRECYEQLTDMVTDGTSTDTLVTGSPGIGKSSWQYHLLQRLASTGCSVVLDWANCNKRLLFTPKGAFTGSKNAFDEELKDPKNYFLVDGQLPKNAMARRIETCAPVHSKLWEFIKEGASMKFMPPWALKELEAALPLYPSVTLKHPHFLYLLWGGSVRSTLAQASKPCPDYKDLIDLLKATIGRSDLDALQQAMAITKDTPQEVTSLLLHYIPDEDLCYSHVAMASPYVSDQICRVMAEVPGSFVEVFGSEHNR